MKLTQYVARKRSNVLLFICLVILCYGSWTYFSRLSIEMESDSGQEVIDYIATRLKVTVTAGDNITTSRSVIITLTNTGYYYILYGNWRIYFYALSPQTTYESAGFNVSWVNGGLYYLSPLKKKFKGISPGESVQLVLRDWKCSAKSDQFPNWYVASSIYGQTSPRIIESTRDESLSFVSPFENAFQWKKHELDTYNPYSPRERYMVNNAVNKNLSKDKIQVIPKPLTVKSASDVNVVFDKSWVVVKQTSVDSNHVSPSKLLASKLGLKSVQQTTSSKYIEFKTDKNFNEEEYEIQIKSQTQSIEITSKRFVGAFYGVQTLISMLESSFILPEVVVRDEPRFKYRGFMIDVARNFHDKTTIKKLIDMMSRYKMNKLHFHLTDDDGWRIQIPALPELTSYGSRRCNYFEKERCLSPNLGSGPFKESTGSGFYTVSDFREILRYATERHVQVIPEIDIPGHAFAAVKAMQFRETNSKQSARRSSFLLSDDVSGKQSVQGWVGNSLNPCMNSSYRFVETILIGLKEIYKGVHTLDLVHIGGDEVPGGVWEESLTCQSLFHGTSLDHGTVKRMFVLTIADIAYKHGLNISIWEDGIYSDIGPYNPKEFKQKQVYVNVWNNIWEQGLGGRAIEYADAGHKVVLSMATHLYFDHPYEPDPEERGLYWATRYTDTYKVFGFIPMNIFANADFDSFGNKIDWNDLCKGPCPQTKSPQNYVGMEACLWTETVRNESQLDSMVFPRLLAFAERAWHKADWEDIIIGPEREKAKHKDFKRFADIVGRKEIRRLERAGVSYRIPPPGITFTAEDRLAKVNSFYQGHKIMVALGNDSEWMYVRSEFRVPLWVSDIYARAVSPVLKRESRTVHLHISGAESVCYSIYVTVFITILQIIVNR